MKVFIVGNGGREHALLWKLARDAPSPTFHATRPNAGMLEIADPVDISPTDVEGCAAWAEGAGIDLTVVGPEVPLADGIVDAFRRRSLPIFGPTGDAARIESSKAFAKELMIRSGVPTAAHASFTELEPALAYIRDVGGPLFVKASGLAAGKGAVPCDTTEEALETARDMLTGEAFGAAGREIVVEELMEGEEISVFGVSDGREVVLLLPSQDHKRIGEGDTGPNTGGMGAYAPVPWVGPDLVREIRERVFLPVLEGMSGSGTPYQGLLFAGLILTSAGLRVIEFNCRFGDPETQAILPLMETSLLDLMLPVARDGALGETTVEWRAAASLNTVLASGGYPGTYEKGKEITLPPDLSERVDLHVFHAGTTRKEGRLLTSGGRVLSVVGLGRDLSEARARSVEAAAKIEFEGKYFRRDIGGRALTGR